MYIIRGRAFICEAVGAQKVSSHRACGDVSREPMLAWRCWECLASSEVLALGVKEVQPMRGLTPTVPQEAAGKLSV